MGTVFTQEDIRREIERLDRMTGLNGAKLEIKKCKGRSRLAYFAYPKGKEPFFAFSVTYFEDADFPDAEKKATIEHEYAHYMDYMKNGFSSHGYSWMQCCEKIHTSSLRCLSRLSVNYHKEQERIAEEKKQPIKGIETMCTPGKKINHPRFGTGTIIKLSGNTANDMVTVNFDNYGEKLMSLEWINNNSTLLGLNNN